MYLHLGSDVIINKKDIIAILDLDNTSTSKITREFLRSAQKQGKIKDVNTQELPKSYVVCKNDDEFTVYVSPISAQTLVKRTNSDEFTI